MRFRVQKFQGVWLLIFVTPWGKTAVDSFRSFDGAMAAVLFALPRHKELASKIYAGMLS